MAGHSIRRWKRRDLLVSLQGGLCAYCFKPMAPPLEEGGRYNPRSVTMDEVFPRARGGRLSANSVAACAKCNWDKDDQEPTGCQLIALAWVNAMVVEVPQRVEDRVALGLPARWKAFKQWKWVRQKDRKRRWA